MNFHIISNMFLLTDLQMLLSGLSVHLDVPWMLFFSPMDWMLVVKLLANEICWLWPNLMNPHIESGCIQSLPG